MDYSEQMEGIQMPIKPWSTIGLLLALPFLTRFGFVIIGLVADGCPGVPPSLHL